MPEGKGTSSQCCACLIASITLVACSLTDDLDELSSGVPPNRGGAAGSTSGGGTGGTSSPSHAGRDGGVATSPDEARSGGPAGTGNPDAGGAGATRVVWLERGNRSAHAANVDGSESEQLLTAAIGARLVSIAVDGPAGRFYFIDELRQRIHRANLDGSDEQNWLTGLEVPAGLDVDVSAGKIYFTERGGTSRVQRANLDGTQLEVLMTDVEQPRGVAVDAAAGKLYVADDGLDALLSADLDGTNVVNLNITDVSDPLEISIDPVDAKLYWSERGESGPRIRRANLDGSSVEDIVTTAALPGFSAASGLEVDRVGRRLYFVDGGNAGSILRANLDGSGAALILGDLDEPIGLALLGP